MKPNYLVRTVYLYLFALMGLVLLVIGGIRFVDMGLKIFVFTQADMPERIQQDYSFYCQQGPIPATKLESLQNSDDLTLDEKQTVKTFLENYRKCQTETAKIDYLASRRQREAATNSAFMIIGLPLYLYHWLTIKKDAKKLSNV